MFLSCKKYDPPESPKDIVEINKPPSSFAVTISKITSDYVSIEWTASSDPENDKIVYSIYLNNSIIADSISSVFTYKIENLNPEKQYTGFVKATDSKFNSTKESFTFTTKKYFIKFSKIYGFNDNFTTGRSIVENDVKGYVIAGFNVPWELALVSIDSLGNEIWRKTYPYINQDVLQIRKTTDNGYIIAGLRYVLKISNWGDKLWDYVVNFDENDSQFTSIIQTNDNGYLVTGTGYSTPTSDTEVSLIKLDSNGIFQWNKYYDKPEGAFGFYGTWGSYIEKTSDDSYILLGSTWTTNMHVYIIKVDDDGQVIWNKILTAGQHMLPKQIKMTADNGFIILSDAVSGPDVHKPRIIKIDNDGNIIWDQYYQLDALSAQPFAICQTQDGGYAITGETHKAFTGFYKAACFLIKLKADGTFDWEKLYSYGDDHDYWWTGNDLLQTKDNGFVITGLKSCIFAPQEKEWGYWVLKTDPAGEFEY
jgi:hypothetical protein